MKDFQFLKTCVDFSREEVDDLNAMIREGTPVTRKTFLKHCDAANVERSLGYESHGSKGLTMARDPHVAYFRSIFRGAPCYYFVWSAIEHIFVRA